MILSVRLGGREGHVVGWWMLGRTGSGWGRVGSGPGRVGAGEQASIVLVFDFRGCTIILLPRSLFLTWSLISLSSSNVIPLRMKIPGDCSMLGYCIMSIW